MRRAKESFSGVGGVCEVICMVFILAISFYRLTAIFCIFYATPDSSIPIIFSYIDNTILEKFLKSKVL